MSYGIKKVPNVPCFFYHSRKVPQKSVGKNGVPQYDYLITLPETNSSPLKVGPRKKEIPIGRVDRVS